MTEEVGGSGGKLVEVVEEVVVSWRRWWRRWWGRCVEIHIFRGDRNLSFRKLVDDDAATWWLEKSAVNGGGILAKWTKSSCGGEIIEKTRKNPKNRVF